MTIQKRELSILYAVVFLGYFAYALTIALFIPMLMDKDFALLPASSTTSLRNLVAGFLLAMYPLGQFLGSPIIGKLSDHYGRKKILLLTLNACLLGFVGIALSIQTHQIELLFICCFLTGLCESNMAISQSVIADNTVGDDVAKTRLIAYVYSVCSLGYVVGPLVGGFGATWFGYSSPFWLSAAGVLALILWLKVGLTDHHHVTASEPINYLEAITALKTLANKPKIYFINFLIFFAVFGLYRVTPLYVFDTWNPPVHVYALLISYVSVLCLLANLFLTGRLAKRYSTKNLLVGLLIAGGLIIFTIVVPENFNSIWITYGLAVIPTVMALTVCTSWLSNHMAKDQQGQALGNNQALLVLGESLSAMFGGLVATIMVPLPVVTMGVMLLVAGALVFFEA